MEYENGKSGCVSFLFLWLTNCQDCNQDYCTAETVSKGNCLQLTANGGMKTHKTTVASGKLR